MKYIELFAGIGGFRKALDTQGHECVWSNEIDKHAINIYNNYYGENNEPTDIRTVKSEDIPDHELLVGGFPCQSFSVAGKRRGFEDTRGTLFFEIARILKTKQPRYVLLENVKGLINHDGGETFTTILKTFDELGYDVTWQLLNSKHFGVPQNRERVFISGVLRGSGGHQILPIRESNTKINDNTKQKNVVGFKNSSTHDIKINYDNCPAICARDYKDPKIVIENIQIADYRNDEGLRIRKNNLCPTLSTRRHSETDISTMPPLVLQEVQVYDDYNSKIRKENIMGTLTCNIGSKAERNGQKIIVSPVQLGQGPKTYAVQNSTVIGSKDEAFTIRAANPNGVLIAKKIRRLTPKECYRLQGFCPRLNDGTFDDSFYEKAKEVASDTQIYKTAGNAVTVNVITEIAKHF